MPRSTPALPAAPVLGQALGGYSERRPARGLELHFERTWCHVAPSGMRRPVAIVPDGHADLQWLNGTLRAAGPDRTVNTEDLPASSVVIGLRFRPASLARWLGVAASALVDARAPLEALWGAEARRIADYASEGRSPEAIAQRLEHALLERASRVPAPDPAGVAIFRTVAASTSTEAEVTQHICRALGMSERTVRRRSLEAFGYGPKTLHRILRFQGFLQRARACTTAGPLAQLATEAGYADQAHLCKEARLLSGMTPSSILEQLS
jgi:AraC-like DNA-binding protein